MIQLRLFQAYKESLTTRKSLMQFTVLIIKYLQFFNIEYYL